MTVVQTGLDFFTSAPSFAALGDKLIFTNTDETHGTELWVSDGTGNGTVLLRSILPGTTGTFANALPEFLTTVGGVVYFQDGDGRGGVDLWKTDGTTAGTVLVKHIEDANLVLSVAQQALDLANLSAQGKPADVQCQ